MSYNNRVQFTRVRNVAIPRRANRHDAGTDFFVPFYEQQFLEDMIVKNANNKIFYKPIIEKDENDKDNITEMEDVDITEVSDGQVLSYDSSTNKWKNADATSVVIRKWN